MMSQFKIQIAWEHAIFRFDISTFKKYYDEFNKYSARQYKDLDQQFEEAIKGASEEYEAHLSDHYSELGDTYRDTFPQIINNTTLVSVFTLFEKRVRKAHALVARYIKVKIKESKAGRMSGPEEYINGIKRMSGINLDSFNTCHEKIIGEIKEIRNIIVHHEANILMEDGETLDPICLKIVKKDKRIKLDKDSGDIDIEDPSYILDFIDNVSFYLKGIYSELRNLPSSDFKLKSI
jgi:hypothetical protein